MIETPTAKCAVGSDVCVIQFAKLPQYGRVKTRMQPRLSAEEALQLHCDLVRHTFENLRKPDEWDFQLWVSARGVSPDFFDTLVGQTSVPVEVQQGDDLGARMGHSLEQVLQSYSLVIIVGSDCPSLDVSRLQELVKVLRNDVSAALIPADDGGYVALGLSRFSGALFRNVDWGTDQVYDQTVAHLRGLNWPFFEANSLADIDRPEDLTRLREYDWGRSWAKLSPADGS